MKGLKITFKVILFIIIFYILTCGVAFLLKDDLNSYTRILTHDFYNQTSNVDLLFCGASHVSHGMDAKISDKEFNCNSFNLGTPSQGINGTYAIINQAIKTYKISKIFLEADFAVACRDDGINPKMGKSDFLVSGFIHDRKIKNQFIWESSSADNILNAVLPIGKDKLLTLSPDKILSKSISLINGKYFKYNYESKDSEYAGKGCVMDYATIGKGGFSNDDFESEFKPVTDYWKNYIVRIIELCKKNNVEIVFYSMPCSDFYLHEKGNYDYYYYELKDFFESLGYEYYDFNLCKEEFNIPDEFFSDDNHLNKQGIEKYSRDFCNFFTGKISREEMFYESYEQKCNSQGPRVYGLLIIKSEDGNSFEIVPVKNVFSEDLILYDVEIEYDSKVVELGQKTSQKKFTLPKGTSGKIKVKCYVGEELSNNITENYAAL